ncbi:MAG: hypothetical protein ACLPTF_14120 [Steroidobacteraceae bacterium]
MAEAFLAAGSTVAICGRRGNATARSPGNTSRTENANLRPVVGSKSQRAVRVGHGRAPSSERTR